MISLTYEQKEELGYKAVRDLLEPVSPYGKKRWAQSQRQKNLQGRRP